eukprot:2108413-Amphidinium_carterae.1
MFVEVSQPGRRSEEEAPSGSRVTEVNRLCRSRKQEARQVSRNETTNCNKTKTDYGKGHHQELQAA